MSHLNNTLFGALFVLVLIGFVTIPEYLRHRKISRSENEKRYRTVLELIKSLQDIRDTVVDAKRVGLTTVSGLPLDTKLKWVDAELDRYRVMAETYRKKAGL